MNILMIIYVFVACVFMLAAIGFVLWKIYETIKYLIETLINLHDIGR